jgi:prephenate dehydrogenase
MPKIAIIGTGLIGTSLGMALKQSQLKELYVVGTDSEHYSRSGAQKKGAFDKVENRLFPALDDADIVVLATPVMAMKDLMQVMGQELKAGCVVTDVGSSKGVVLEWADQYLPDTVDFIGGHPMAGKETPGPEEAEAELFIGKIYCVIPSQKASKKSVAEITTLVEAVGAKPYFISIDEHDSFVAAASHLPFLLSMALVGCTSKSSNWEDIAQLASSGYRDISRLAAGDPVMHRDICVSNPKPIVAWIDSFIRELHDFRQMLDSEAEPDPDAVKKIFDQANEARAKWMAGAVTLDSRDYSPHSELPTFGESMGEMFMGRRIMDARKKFTNIWSNKEAKK